MTGVDPFWLHDKIGPDDDNDQDGVFDAFHLDWVEPPTVDRVRRMADADVEFLGEGEAAMAFSGATMLTLYAYEYEWLDDGARWAVPFQG